MTSGRTGHENGNGGKGAEEMGEARAKVWRWDEIPVDDLPNGGDRQWVTGDGMMLAKIHAKKGVAAPPHSHDSEQFTWVVEGALRFTIGKEGNQEVVDVRAGEVLVVPPYVPHGAQALEDTYEIDVWTPPRQGWIDLREEALPDE